MFNKVTKTFQYGQHSVTLETGEIARQASGAVLVSMEDTVVRPPLAHPSPPFPNPAFSCMAPVICDVRSCPGAHAKDRGGGNGAAIHDMGGRRAGAPFEEIRCLMK